MTGAGPIGLLGPLLGKQSGLEVHVLARTETGPKPELVRSMGATYHTCSVANVGFEPDIILECTGGQGYHRVDAHGPCERYCIGHRGHLPKVATADMASAAVLRNNVIFGSVNANTRHWYKAAEVLALADGCWLAGLITKREQPENFVRALTRGLEDVKVVIQFSEL